MFLVTFLNVPSHQDNPLTVYPPVGILSMSACLKKEGYDANYIDADILRLKPDKVIELLTKRKPNLIGVSLNVSQVSFSVNYIKEIKRNFPKIPIVLGGPYVSSVQEKIFADFPFVDFAIVGEGEYAIVDLIKYLLGKKEIYNVRNLLYRLNGKTKKNEVERILNLDLLPLPDYELVLSIMERYSGPYPSIASPSIAIMATRGCPFNCSFCSSPISWNRKLTVRSTDSIIREIKYLKQLIDVKEIFFQDDTLNLRSDWFYELCDKIIANGLNNDIYFKGPFGLDKKLLTMDMLLKAKEANFWMIFYGIESGNQEMLNSMNKNINIDDVVRAFKITRKTGICSYASFMIGNSGETKKTVSNSIKLIKKIKADFGAFSIAAPFPGTKLYETVKKKQLLLLDDFKQYQFGDCILETESLKKKDILELYHKANYKFLKFQKSVRYKTASKNNCYKKIIGEGFYNTEMWHAPVRRTKKAVKFWLPKSATNSDTIYIKILADYPDISIKPVKLRIWISKEKFNVLLSNSEWKELKFPIRKDSCNRYIPIKWKVDRTWNPKKFGLSEEDNRELGITVEKINLV